jgi:hypothetical protein
MEPENALFINEKYELALYGQWLVIWSCPLWQVWLQVNLRSYNRHFVLQAMLTLFSFNHFSDPLNPLRCSSACFPRTTFCNNVHIISFANYNVSFQNIKKCFADDSIETIRVRGVTYCIKSRDSEQIVSFNGQTYIIVCKTNYMYIVAKCSSRKTSGRAAQPVDEKCCYI